MALTRDFKETIQARAQRDTRFRQALFTEAINAYLAGDTAAGKAILRDLVNATVGFEALAFAIDLGDDVHVVGEAGFAVKCAGDASGDHVGNAQGLEAFDEQEKRRRFGLRHGSS